MKLKVVEKEKEFNELKNKFELLEKSNKERMTSNEIQKTMLNSSIVNFSNSSKTSKIMPLVIDYPSSCEMSPPQSPITKIAPPPPPPPPPMLLESTKSKNIPKSNQPMKTINWTKLPFKTCAGTLWEKLNEDETFKLIDLYDLQEKFSIKEANKTGGSKYESNYGSVKPRQIPSVLDIDRAKKCELFLKFQSNKATIKAITNEIVRKIYHFDTTSTKTKFAEDLVSFSIFRVNEVKLSMYYCFS